MIFISHPSENYGDRYFPEKLLKEHLLEVGLNSATYIEELSIMDKPLIKKCAFIVGISHDFGKYTTYFQDHIRKNKPKSQYSQHSYISAIFGAYLGFKILDPEERFASLYIYFAIRHHHGNLTYLDEDIPKRKVVSLDTISDMKIREKLKIIQKQIEDLWQNLTQISDEIESVISHGRLYGITGHIDISDFFQDGWINAINSLFAENRKFIKAMVESNNLASFFQFMLIYSSLIDGDKRSAARIEEFERSTGMSLKLFDRYIADINRETLPQTISNIINSLSSKIDENTASIDLSNHILTITAPTGSGKTLAAMKAAIRIRNQVADIENRSLRIVYALPFTSIIDQTYETFRKILSQNEEFSLKSERFIIKHHHMADFDENVSEEDSPLDLAIALTESWDSEIIVTTFVQVFQSIIGNKNRSIKKFHRMANSIIILDEIQSIRVELWKMLGEIIKQMSKLLNVYFILMTATQPQIISRDISQEIGFENFPDILNRTVLKYSPEPKSLDEIVDYIVSSSNNCQTVLIIRNTIRSSISVYQELKNRISDLKNSPKLYYLSTNITPKDRVARIENIKGSLKRMENTIVVSTQVIEAGIDLSFDVVIREIAPIDSLIQAAGRCNRKGEREKPGEVLIVNEAEDNGYSMEYSKSSIYVYGKIAMDITAQTLKKFGGVIYERCFPELMKNYFDELCKRNMCDQPLGINRLIESMSNLSFDRGTIEDYYSEPAYFSILENSRLLVDVFVVRSDDDQDLLDRFKESVIFEKNPFIRKKNMLQIRTAFRQCIISVDFEFARKLNAVPVKDENGIYVLERGLAEEFYDDETGLKRAYDAFLTL